MAYDPNNIFAKILRDEIPSIRVHEDDATVALMDIMPRADGHVLVIPKGAARNVLDATPEQLAACMATVQKVARACMKAFGAGGITLLQANEAAAGQEVPHLHFHVMPRHDGQKLRPPASVKAEVEVLQAHAEKIRKALAG